MTTTIFFIIFFTGCFFREIYDTCSKEAKDNPVYYFLSLLGAVIYAALAANQIEDLIKLIHQL